jgi:hypothetical protein
VPVDPAEPGRIGRAPATRAINVDRPKPNYGHFVTLITSQLALVNAQLTLMIFALALSIERVALTTFSLP